MGGHSVSLGSIGAIQQICETITWSLVGKHRKTRFFDVFWPKTKFFSHKGGQFYCWRTFYSQMGGYPVILSSIGALQQICETITWSLVGKHQKTRFFDVFWRRTKLFSIKVVNFIVGAPFATKCLATL